MIESIEQAMRTLKLGGLAKEWRSVAYENTEQYVSDLLSWNFGNAKPTESTAW